jgi:spore coat protein A
MNFKLSRREFLKGAAVAGVGVALPLKFGVRESHAFYQSPGLRKWQTTLRGIGTIPVAAWDVTPAPITGVKHYTINIQQFTDQLYPVSDGTPLNFGPTTLWGFHPANVLAGSSTPKHLGGIIVAQKGEPIQITFRNNLNVTKHIIPLDTTIPGANQGVNRVAIHLHGGLVPWISDGGPFDWWTPNGTHGLSFLNNQVLKPGAAANEAEYYYPNNQSARLVWYHDHAFGNTRINAYAGIASGYIIRDAFEAGFVGPAGLPDFIEHGGREIPIVIQDKIFVNQANIGALDPTWPGPKTTGSLWYPHLYERNRWRLLGAGRGLPNPSVIAEMFGDTMLVNGTVYPEVSVEPRRYRLRFLNACNARFLNLQFMVEGGGQGPDFLVLGNECGFLQNPVLVPSNIPFNPITLEGSLITGNAERWDVIVDFKDFKNKNIILYNDAPAPFPSGDPRNDFVGTVGSGPDTREIMRFRVGNTASGIQDQTLLIDESTDFTPGIDPFLADFTTGLPTVPVTTTRKLTLNESFDAYGRLTQQLGTNVPVSPGKFGRTYLDPVTETPTEGDVEVWEIFNLTADTHPIHFHLVNVQILNRQPFDVVSFPAENWLGAPRPPLPTELGWKETVIMHPGEVTRVIMKFDIPKIYKADKTTVVPTPPSPRTGKNEYVWHCHILEHEEHDMMRPLVVAPKV